jgi:hypothetical protein
MEPAITVPRALGICGERAAARHRLPTWHAARVHREFVLGLSVAYTAPGPVQPGRAPPSNRAGWETRVDKAGLRGGPVAEAQAGSAS